jgi:hypothetical protein
VLERTEGVEVIGQAVVLDKTAVLGLVWRHNTIGVVDGALGEVAWLTTAQGLRALGLLDPSGYPQSHPAIDAALATAVMLAVAVQGMPFVA